MSTLSVSAARVKPSPADLARQFLRDRGYDAATVEAARYDESVISPADAASVQRIIADACTPAPAVQTDRYTAERATARVHRDGARMHEARRAAEHLGAGYALLAPVDLLNATGPGLSADEVDAIVVDELVRHGLASRVEFTPAPAPVPTYSDDADVESAVDEGRACLYPASDRYKQNMALLTDSADRTAAFLADARAFVAEQTAPRHPAALDVDGADEGYAEQAAWDAMCEAADALNFGGEPDDYESFGVPHGGHLPAPVTRCPECGTRTDGEPCVICDDFPAPRRSPARPGVPALCGGSGVGAGTTYETRPDRGSWVVTRDGRTVFRSRFMVTARSEMARRAGREAAGSASAVLTLFHSPTGRVVGQTLPAQVLSAASGYLMPAAVALGIARTRTGGHDA